MRGVRERKRKMVTGLNEMYVENYKNTGALLIFGWDRAICRSENRRSRFPTERAVNCAG